MSSLRERTSPLRPASSLEGDSIRRARMNRRLGIAAIAAGASTVVAAAVAIATGAVRFPAPPAPSAAASGITIDPTPTINLEAEILNSKQTRLKAYLTTSLVFTDFINKNGISVKYLPDPQRRTKPFKGYIIEGVNTRTLPIADDPDTNLKGHEEKAEASLEWPLEVFMEKDNRTYMRWAAREKMIDGKLVWVFNAIEITTSGQTTPFIRKTEQM